MRFINLFVRNCPNCESAWTGGCADPEDIEWCLMCSNPRTGRMRSWVWRPRWLSRRTTNANLKVFRAKEEAQKKQAGSDFRTVSAKWK